jgi:hypothetical protein
MVRVVWSAKRSAGLIIADLSQLLNLLFMHEIIVSLLRRSILARCVANRLAKLGDIRHDAMSATILNNKAPSIRLYQRLFVAYNP